MNPQLDLRHGSPGYGGYASHVFKNNLFRYMLFIFSNFLLPSRPLFMA